MSNSNYQAKLAAVLLVVGTSIAIVSGFLHPAKSDPSNSLNAFAEYAAHDHWTSVHLGQLIGYTLTFIAIVLLSKIWDRSEERGTVFAVVAGSLSTACIAVYAVLQGLDAITLKAMVDRWVAATDEQALMLLGMAELARWAEIGVNSTFRILQGATYVALGLAIFRSSHLPPFVGAAGILIGAIVIARGVAVAFSGFSLENPVYANTSLFASNAPLLLAIWLWVVSYFTWTRLGLQRN